MGSVSNLQKEYIPLGISYRKLLDQYNVAEEYGKVGWRWKGLLNIES